MTAENINSSIDLVHAVPPFRPLTESLSLIYITTPRPWIRIRKLIRNLHTDVLQRILEILSCVLECTANILSHTSMSPKISPSDLTLIDQALMNRIRARRLVTLILKNAINDFIFRFLFTDRSLSSLEIQSIPTTKAMGQDSECLDPKTCKPLLRNLSNELEWHELIVHMALEAKIVALGIEQIY